MKILRVCLKCDKEFYFRAAPTDISSGRGKFCSVGCRMEARWKLPKSFSCEKCGRDFPNQFGKRKRFCSHLCYSLTLVGKSPSNKGVFGNKYPGVGDANRKRRGELHYNWQGGISSLRDQIKRLEEYGVWRKSVFLRDGFTCVMCGEERSGKIEADHIVPFSFLLKRYRITSLELAQNCAVLWNIENGRTLCVGCHKNTETWGKGAKNYVLPNHYLHLASK